MWGFGVTNWELIITVSPGVIFYKQLTMIDLRSMGFDARSNLRPINMDCGVIDNPIAYRYGSEQCPFAPSFPIVRLASTSVYSAIINTSCRS